MTIITHGFSPFFSAPEWTYTMADAILDRADSSTNRLTSYGSVYVHDTGNGRWKAANIPNRTNTDRADQHVVLIFDWATESDKKENGWLEAAADSLFAALQTPPSQLNALSSSSFLSASHNLHFIGHSRGAVLNSRVCNRIGWWFPELKVDHVTTLDPHPAGPMSDIGYSLGTSTLDTYQNVKFSDNYYRRDPDGYEPALDFSGVGVNGVSFQRELSESTLSSSDSLPHDGPDPSSLEHVKVHAWYHGTIAQAATSDGVGVTIPADGSWYSSATMGPRAGTGYSYSRVANGHSDFSETNNRRAAERVPVLFNGSFDFVNLSAGNYAAVSSLPGWEQHGGGGDGFVNSEGNFLRLTQFSSKRTHNPFYLPPNSSDLKFDYRVSNAGANDRLKVLLNDGASDYLLADIDAAQIVVNWARHSRAVPDGAKGKVCTLSFQLVNPGIGLVNAFAQIDNVSITTSSAPAGPARPTIASVSPRILTAAPSSVFTPITIAGTGFTSDSKLRYTRLDDNFTYPDAAPLSATATQLSASISVGLTPRSWSVSVVDSGVASDPYTFYVVSGAAELTALSIQGPATVTENGNGQFSATALFSNGSQQPSVTPVVWGLTGSGASINPSSGYLTASSVGANSAVTVTASYTTGGVTKSTSASVTIVDVGSGGGSQSQELSSNGGFENGATGWTMSGPGVFGTYPHTGAKYAVMGELNNVADTMYQTISIPANATAATLSYWYNIVSAETGSTPFDVLNVTIQSASGSFLATVDTKSNVHKEPGAGNPYYRNQSFDLLPYKGQTIRVHFLASTDGNTLTSFKIDDVSVQVSVPPPVTLVSLAINGPSAVAEGTFGTYYTATAIYSDGSTNLVNPTWQLHTSFGTLLSNGELRTDYVIADVATNITATFGGQTANKMVTIVDVAPTFSYVAVSGPTAINESSSGQFTATAIFSDGTSQSASATWSVSGTGASIGLSSGLLSAGEVSADTVVTVSATATVGGVTRSGSQQVTIVNSAASPTLTSLSIAGPSSLNKNSTAQYSATATFSDGSTQTANPTWSEDSTATSISSFGLLSAGEVASDTVITVTASYTAGGITRIASKSVTVVNGVATPQPGTLQFSSPVFSGNEGSGTAGISVVRTGGSAGAVGVSYTTANGTATAGADYSATNGILSWADGDTTTKTFNVIIIEDDLVEGNETVTLTLSSPMGGAALGTLASASLTIVDNDLGGSGALPVAIASGLNVPGGMALDGNDVYFSDNTASDGIIKRVSKDGGTITTVVSGAVLNDAGAARGVARFVINDGNIFGEYGGYESHAIFRALASGGGTRTTLTSENGGSFIGVSGGNIYYGSGFSNLRSMSTNGGSPNQLLNGYWVRGSAIDSTNVYFIEYYSQNVLRYNIANSTVTPLITGNATEGGIFIDADRVFFNIDGSIKMVAKSGGVVTTLVSSTTAAGHVSDGISLFFTENGAIKSLPLSGGAPTFILTEPAGGVGLAVDETFLYYSDRSGGPGAGRIFKMPKTGLQPPVITSGLTNQTASVGTNVLFSVAAYGLTPLTYQWFKDATILPGVTTSNLALVSVQLTNAGSYTVVASDSRGVISVSIAVLAVGPAQGSKLVAWGANNAGQRDVPENLVGVVAVAGGSAHTLALRNDGNLLAWGQNTYGESTVPVVAQSGVTAIAAGVDHSLALKRDGTLVAWGRNNRGQATVPAAAQTGVIAVAAGEAHSLVLKGDGSAFAWGHNFYSQGSVPAAAQSGVVAIAARGAHNLALKTNGTVVAWGYNGAGESTVPAGLSGVVAIAAGENHSVALKADGTVVAWGADQFGQGSVPSGLSGVVAIAAGGYYNLALRVDGTVMAWGDDREGQAAVPAVIQGKILRLAAGNHHTLALVDPLQLAPPSITTQPTGLIHPSGSNATFTVVVNGATPMLYQWKKNSIVLAGETNAQLQLMNLRRVDSAQYSVAISNTFGGVLSSNATLRVIVRQSFVNAPVRLGDGGFRLLFGDHDGGLLTAGDATNIVVEVSPDFVNWVTLTNAFTISNGQVQVDDTGSANLPRRFYRVIER